MSETSRDLEAVVFRAIALNTPGKQPAAVLAAIRETHVVIDRERWERVRSCRALKHLTPEALVTMQGLHPGDLDPE
jgi:hypothetical protein